MIRLLLIVLTFVSGIGLSCQAATNGALGKSIGVIEAALVSFFVGTLSLLLAMLFFGKGNIVAVFSVPKWQLLGGLMGAIYIAVLVITVPRIGVVVAVLSAVCGQMAMSMAIDNFGWFHGEKIPFNWLRFFGVVLLAAALICIYRGSLSTNHTSQTAIGQTQLSSSKNV